MYLLIPTIVSIIASFIGAIIDIKYKIIPNNLNFFLIIFGLMYYLALSFFLRNFYYIAISAASGIIIFLISYCFWKFGLWGGGDLKLFTGIAILLPIYPNLFPIFNIFSIDLWFPQLNFYFFSITILFNSFLLSIPFIFCYTLFIQIKHRNNTIPLNKISILFIQTLINTKLINIKLINIIIIKIKKIKIKKILKSILCYLYIIFKKIKIKNIFLSFFILLILNLFFNSTYIFNSPYIFSLNTITYILKIFLISILMVFISLFKSQIIFKMKNFIKKISHLHCHINDLKNEMILSPLSIELNDESKDILSKADNLILIKNKKIRYFFNSKIQLNLKNIYINNKNPSWKIKTNLNGLSMKDISILKELSEKKYIDDNFFIKITISFAPAIFLSIVYSVIFGDLLILISKLLVF